jgi:transposase-like protein
LQIALRTQSSAEAYITNREWRDARLFACPLHADGNCSFARHGSYSRVTPQGLRIARWYCPEGHRTFSLLPDFLAARLPGLLSSIEAAVDTAKSARSLESAADVLRGFEVTLPSAVRWLRRRVRAVKAAIDAVPLSTLQTATSALASSPATRIDAGCGVLLELRRALPPLSPMATSNSPTCGQSNSPRQDGWIMSQGTSLWRCVKRLP